MSRPRRSRDAPAEVVEMGYVERRYGKYRVRYRDPSGRLTSRPFPRRADAERFAREMEVEVSRGSWIDPRAGDVPLAVWAEQFLSLARRLSPSTQATYARDLRSFVLPRFGSYRIGRIPPEEVEDWLNDEIAAGVAPSSVHRHYRTLRRVLQVAVVKQKLLANPCDRVEPPRVPKREMTFLTWPEVVALAEAHDERYRALVYVAVDTGMRWSELVGLRRARVDLRARKVRVTEQLIRLGPGDWLRKEPKTPASRRSITVSPVTADLLAAHLERFSLPGPDGLVFPNATGGPLISSSFLSHHFGPARRAVGLACRFHDLRHTSVALAIAASAHPKAIQARMGHSSIAVTLDRYGHLLPSSTRPSPPPSASSSTRPAAGWGGGPWSTPRSRHDALTPSGPCPYSVPMPRSYDDVMAARRRRLSLDGTARLAAFEQAYDIAMQVVALREGRRLTQAELAASTGIDQADISRIEGGSTNPPVSTLQRIAAALGAELRLVPVER